MILNKQTFAEKEGTRLLVGNLPFSLEQDEFMRAFARYGHVQGGFLSRPTMAGRNNAGWGIVEVDEVAARDLLAQTVLIGGRVARIKRARPKIAA
jgi:RNA recognition motif-containing protein